MAPPGEQEQRQCAKAAGVAESGEQQQQQHSGGDPAATQAATTTRKELAWVCGECERECWPIRAESRCLCGHRLKEHGATCAAGPSSPSRATTTSSSSSTAAPAAAATAQRACRNARCGCKGFFFIVAEGAWTLRCSCKHKAVEHDAQTHACAKKGCACSRFASPWVCNCDHPWAAHRQVEVERKVTSLAARMGGLAGAAAAAAVAAEAAAEMERWRIVERGQGAA